MNPHMSEITRQEVLAQKRQRYATAGRPHKAKIITELVDLFGYHRKAAIRALRPKEYSAAQLLPPLKVIWLAALQPCGKRLKACLPDWLPAYEADHRRLDTDVRQALLAASRATLDRLLIPARVAHRRRAATRPGSRRRAEIPIRTAFRSAPRGPKTLPATWKWTPWRGVAARSTIGMAGGSTRWMSTPPGACCVAGPTAAQPVLAGIRTTSRPVLPFPMRGLDSDHGGEFINH